MARMILCSAARANCESIKSGGEMANSANSFANAQKPSQMTSMQPSFRWTVYALVDPRSRQVRYVGVTRKLLSQILRKHSSGRDRLHEWIKELRAVLSAPEIVELETGEGDGWRKAERLWIKFYRTENDVLLNKNKGCASLPTDQQRRNLSEKMLGHASYFAPPIAGASSLYRGVKWHADDSVTPWEALVKLGGKWINLGRFSSELKAALAYNEVVRRVHGDRCAFLNRVDEHESASIAG